MNFEKYGGRRFLMALFCQCVTAGLQWAGKLDAGGTSYTAITVLVLGTYTAANVTQRIKVPPAA